MRIDNVATGRGLVRDLCAGTIQPTLPSSSQLLCLDGWQAAFKPPVAPPVPEPQPQIPTPVTSASPPSAPVPGWEDHALWCDAARFAKIVKEGCWPLHPAATWFLYRLASVGKSLQQRSAVSLLEEAIAQHRTAPIPADQPWSLPASALCTDTVVKELIGAERYGQQAAIAHAFLSVRDRYEHDLTPQEDRLLRAVLISSKVGLRVGAQSEANQALTILAGTSTPETTRALHKLTGDYGVIGWNARANKYEIIGDAVPRAAFDNWLRDKVGTFTPEQLGELFVRHSKSWSPNLGEIKPAFAEELRIQTKEWRFEAICSCPQFVKQHLREAFNDWTQAFDVETARGRVIFCYVGPDENIQSTQDTVRTTLAELASTKGHHWKVLPIFTVLLHDKSGDLASAIAEWAVLKNSAGTPEVAPFIGLTPGSAREVALNSCDPSHRLQSQSEQAALGIGRETRQA